MAQTVHHLTLKSCAQALVDRRRKGRSRFSRCILWVKTFMTVRSLRT
jgi:hypothetical protein